MLVETIKAKILDAVKTGKEVERDILKLALGEIQTLESRQGSITEEQAQKLLRKLMDSNGETLSAIGKIGSDEKGRMPRLIQEIVILQDLLPKRWTEVAVYCTFSNFIEVF